MLLIPPPKQTSEQRHLTFPLYTYFPKNKDSRSYSARGDSSLIWLKHIYDSFLLHPSSTVVCDDIAWQFATSCVRA